jgi:hypothetical protein
MSNGDDETTDENAGGADEQPEPDDPDPFESRLDEAAEAVDSADTERALDRVEETLDEIESDLDDATFAVELEDEAEEDEDDGEEEEENPRDDLEDRLSDLRDEVDEKRGPYLDDVTDGLGDAISTIESSEWAEEGETEVYEAASNYAESVGNTVDESFSVTEGDPATVAEDLEAIKTALAETDLHPDTDADTIDELLVAGDNLSGNLDDATLWSDLEVREQLTREGFYDVLTPENRKDFPPEWAAIKQYEQRREAEPILSAMDKLGSDFMEENVLDALEHIAPEAAFEQVHALAQRRNKQPVRILGRIGDERACDTLHDFLGGGDVELEQTSLRALGAIGSEESTEPVAQRLAADDPAIRSAAARALGLIGDTRAIEPLADVLAEDDDDSARASAAWALNQIGTKRALTAAAEYADDSSYVVQFEAERAQSV